MKRREWLTLATSASGMFILKSSLPSIKINKKRVLRIAHMTDTHVHSGRDTVEWVQKCIQDLQNQEDPVDMIFNGGDAINDALRRSEEEVIAQWELWDQAVAGITLPVKHCIGNHDVWGIEEAKSDNRYAKQWAVEKLNLENRYYDFEQGGWHFIVLDSTHTKDDGSWYTAKLDEEQFEWLEGKLQSIPSNKPIFIISHIPIMCAASFFDGNNESSGNWVIPGAWVHIDARKIVELFFQHKNIKLCISGHIHLEDTVIYNGITYCCNGAVSGNWWGGNYHQTAPGYAIINLYEDGTFEREYRAYGWS